MSQPPQQSDMRTKSWSATKGWGKRENDSVRSKPIDITRLYLECVSAAVFFSINEYSSRMLSDKREQWDEKRDDRPHGEWDLFPCDSQLLTAKEQDKQQWDQQIMDNIINAVSVLFPLHPFAPSLSSLCYRRVRTVVWPKSKWCCAFKKKNKTQKGDNACPSYRPQPIQTELTQLVIVRTLHGKLVLYRVLLMVYELDIPAMRFLVSSTHSTRSCTLTREVFTAACVTLQAVQYVIWGNSTDICSYGLFIRACVPRRQQWYGVFIA